MVVKVKTETFQQFIGAKLRRRRESLSLTQEEVTNNVDISKAYISDVENGKRSVGLFKVFQLIEFYSVTLDWLVEGWIDG